MAKASQAVILENEFYIIKAPNGKVLEVKNFNTENGAAIHPFIILILSYSILFVKN